jgi:hypothetical protein
VAKPYEHGTVILNKLGALLFPANKFAEEKHQTFCISYSKDKCVSKIPPQSVKVPVPNSATNMNRASFSQNGVQSLLQPQETFSKESAVDSETDVKTGWHLSACQIICACGCMPVN